MANFKQSIDLVFDLEGWHSDHELDPGGDTYFGISKVYWPQHYEAWGGPPTPDQARRFYRMVLWEPLLLGHLKHQLMADEMMDQAVHFGKRRAVRHAQFCVNEALGKSVLVEDGRMGQLTLGALNGMNPVGRVRWYKLMNGLQLMWYLHRVGRLPKWLDLLEDETTPSAKMDAFFLGWLRRVS